MLHVIKPFNFILACDSYKTDHYKELPDFVKRTVSAIVPRRASSYYDRIVAMGQTYVATFMASVRITHEMIDEAEVEITEQGYDFNRAGWEIIANEYGGVLPLSIYAVEEGRLVKPQTPVMAVVNTDERFGWLPSYTETIIQSTVWKMSTVATVSRACRDICKEYVDRTGTPETLDYFLHNFGDRGADSPNEAPVLAGIAHAAVFNGSDCTRANGYIKRMYNTKRAYTSSVEATEHSVMCANSDAETKDDFGAAKMVIERLKAVVERSNRGIGVPVLSALVDTYDSRRFVRDYIGGVFRDEVLNSGGVLVLRADSGSITKEPVDVATDAEGCFGATANDKNYKVLTPCVKVLQGDGLRVDTIRSVLDAWVNAGYSTDSFVLGMGAGITHFGGRDDFSFSMKSVADLTDTGWRRLLKEPKTDAGKKSLSGLVRNFEDEDGNLYTRDCFEDPNTFFISSPGWRLWVTNGTRTYFQSFDDVQSRARAL